ncbi:MAG: creatininase family protein [Candidatus Odinarchaeia archaeon]
MNVLLSDMSWCEVKELISKVNGVIFPVGSLEEHGPHLPLDTDTVLSLEIAKKAAQKANYVVAPPINFGVCRTTRGFPGTMSVGFNSLREFIKDLLVEAGSQGFKNIVVFSWHSGKSHSIALKEACYEVKSERPDFNIALIIGAELWPNLADMLETKPFHGGELETSLMLAVKPEAVRMDNLVEEYPEIPKYVIKTSGKPWLKSGVIGNAKAASRSKGERILKRLIEDLSRILTSFKF